MGRHRSDSEEDGSSRKKKKKSKKMRKRSRSRSRSSTRSHRKTHRYSRSRSRSRSPYQRSRRSRSRSPVRRRSRSPRMRSRSRSPRRRRSRSRSRSPHRYRRSRSNSPYGSKKSSRSSSVTRVEPGIPMPPGKQAEQKLKQALKAAALADEKLKVAGVLAEGTGHSPGARHDYGVDYGVERAAAVEAIEDEGFSPAQFLSSRNTKPSSGTMLATHDNAIFGSMPLDIGDVDPKSILKSGPADPQSLMHPNLFVPAEEKMERWRNKLIAMRKKKLEGEAM